MQASMFVTIGIGGLAVLVASGLVLAYSSAVGSTGGNRTYARMGARTALLAWMTIFAVLAESGTLADFERKPPPLLMAMLMFVVPALVLGSSRIGDTFARGLPLALLVGAQCFRLPLEIVMHQAAREGVMPVEMSYAGYNFDIITGASALVLAWAIREGKASERLIFAWNVLGSVLLAVVLAVAVLSSPMIEAFGDAPEHVNSFIARFPFIWLGTVLVAAAVFLHVVTFRSLRALREASSPRSPASTQPPFSLPAQ